jgi:YihY family inner membrane protein
MGVTDDLDRWQRRHRGAGFPIAVVFKFFDDQGVYLAVLMTYYGFLSLFPLLLLLASVLGFFLQNDAHLQQQILHSTLSQFPIIGDELRAPQGLHGSGIAVVIGGLTELYGALGVAQATQNAMNVAWAVPRNRRPNPIKGRLRSLILLAIAGTAVLTTTTLSAIGSSAQSFGADISGGAAVLATAAAAVVNIAVFVIGFRISTAHKLSTRQALPGAIVAAVFWQTLQFGGTAYFGHIVKNAGATYGAFAVVLGLLAWIFLASLGVVLGAEINVVRVKHLYPRALLTPFTDDVDLTSGDLLAYTDAALAQRLKGFQTVEVTFANDGQNASANRDPGRSHADSGDPCA